MKMVLKVVFSLVVWWSFISSCHGFDDSGNISSRKENTNNVELRISSLPKINLAHGDRLWLTCTGAIYDNSSLKWYKRAGGIDKEIHTSFIKFNIHDYLRTSYKTAGGIDKEIRSSFIKFGVNGYLNMNIENVRKSDAGIYVCKRYLKGIEHKEEVTVSVTVAAPTKPIIRVTALRKVIKGGKAGKTKCRLELVCEYLSGNPIPRFTWRNPNGTLVEYCTQKSWRTQCMLEVGNPEDENLHGTYTCTASNLAGISSQSIAVNTMEIQSFGTDEVWNI